MSNVNGHSNGHHSNGTGKDLVHLNGNGDKPGPPVVTDHDYLWDGLAPAVTKALAQPLDLNIAAQREGRAGMMYNYLKGYVVIEQANRIFGYGGWGYALAGDVTLRQFETVDPRTGEVKTSSAYSAPVRVTVAGAPSRTDVGFHAVTDETPDGHDTALKGAVTDGLKRAFRSFGVQFGNGFYGDPIDPNSSFKPEQVKERTGSRPEEAKTNPKDDSQAKMLRERIIELGAAQGFSEKQVREAVTARTGRNMEELEAADLADLVKAALNKINQTRQNKDT